MATAKKTVNKDNAKKATENKPAAKKKTTAKKENGSSSVVDEFLGTVVGETMTQADAENNEDRKKALKEKNKVMSEKTKEQKKAEAEETVVSEVFEENLEEPEKPDELIESGSVAEEMAEDVLEEAEKEDYLSLNDEIPGFDEETGNVNETNDEIAPEETKDEDNKSKPTVSTSITIVNSAMGASWD